MARVEALRTDLLLVLEAVEDLILVVLRAHRFLRRVVRLHFRLNLLLFSLDFY